MLGSIPVHIKVHEVYELGVCGEMDRLENN